MNYITIDNKLYDIQQRAYHYSDIATAGGMRMDMLDIVKYVNGGGYPLVFVKDGKEVNKFSIDEEEIYYIKIEGGKILAKIKDKDFLKLKHIIDGIENKICHSSTHLMEKAYEEMKELGVDKFKDNEYLIETDYDRAKLVISLLYDLFEK